MDEYPYIPMKFVISSQYTTTITERIQSPIIGGIKVWAGMIGDDLTFGNMHKSGYSQNGTKTVAPLNL